MACGFFGFSLSGEGLPNQTAFGYRARENFQIEGSRPVIEALLHLELVQGQRKVWRYAARWGLGLWFVAVALVLAGFAGKLEHPLSDFFRYLTEPLSGQFYGLWGMLLLNHVLGIHLALILVVLPALAVASLTTEKTTGSLTLLLTTQLSGRVIITGKLLAQMIRVSELLLVGVPWLVLGLALIHTDCRPAYLALPLVEGSFLFGVGALSLLVGTLSRTTTAGILTAYGALACLLLGLEWTGQRRFSPLWLLGGLQRPIQPGELLVLVGTWFLLGSVCLLLAAWRLRSTWAAQLGGGERRDRRVGALPPIVGSPTRWKERHLGWGARRWWLLRQVIALLLMTASGAWASSLVGPQAAWDLLGQSLAVILLLGLIVQVRTAISISSERENQTWDLLRLTQLSSASLIRGKIWGTLDGVFPLLTLTLLPVAVVALTQGIVAFINVIACWLAGWPILYALAACGLAESARTQNSWWSLVSSLWRSLGAYFLRVGPLLFVGMFIAGLIIAALGYIWTLTGIPRVVPRGLELVVPLGLVAFFSFDLAEAQIQRAAEEMVKVDAQAAPSEAYRVPRLPKTGRR